MEWGQYLASGTVQQQKEDEEVKKARYIFSKIEYFFSSIGLSRFSSKIATSFFHTQLSKEDGSKKFSRVLTYIHEKLMRAHSSPSNDLQRGCPNVFKGLTAMPIWSTSDPRLTWIQKLEDNFEMIRDEFLAARMTPVAAKAFQPYRSPQPSSSSCNVQDPLGYLATDKGEWNVCYLYLHGIDFKENLVLFPKTVELINSFPRHYHHAFISAISGKTHITPHYGPTNKKLRCHLPLTVPKGDRNDLCRLIVGGVSVTLVEGKCVVFDDSFLHEAFNDSCKLDLGEPRVVLVIDFWHPDFSDEEVKFLSYVNNAQINTAKKMKAQHEEQTTALEVYDSDQIDFFTIIDNIRKLAEPVPAQLIWGDIGEHY